MRRRERPYACRTLGQFVNRACPLPHARRSAPELKTNGSLSRAALELQQESLAGPRLAKQENLQAGYNSVRKE
jgi:hypothetical protein